MLLAYCLTELIKATLLPAYQNLTNILIESLYNQVNSDFLQLGGLLEGLALAELSSQGCFESLLLLD